MLAAKLTAEQYAEARRWVRTYNRPIARAIQMEDEKVLVSSIQELEGWSEGVAENRRTWVQAVWHAAHETELVGATASAAFHAFRPELLVQLQKPRPSPMSAIIILGAQHETNLGDRAVEYDQPRTVRLCVLLEDYKDTYGRTERRLAAKVLDRTGTPARRIGYLPKDAPRRMGEYLATLHRSEGKKRLEGKLSVITRHIGMEAGAVPPATSTEPLQHTNQYPRWWASSSDSNVRLCLHHPQGSSGGSTGCAQTATSCWAKPNDRDIKPLRGASIVSFSTAELRLGKASVRLDAFPLEQVVSGQEPLRTVAGTHLTVAHGEAQTKNVYVEHDQIVSVPALLGILF